AARDLIAPARLPLMPSPSVPVYRVGSRGAALSEESDVRARTRPGGASVPGFSASVVAAAASYEIPLPGTHAARCCAGPQAITAARHCPAGCARAAPGGTQQAKLGEQSEEEPASVDELIEAAKVGEKFTQVIVTLGASAPKTLSTDAKDQGMTLDDAARTLI